MRDITLFLVLYALTIAFFVVQTYGREALFGVTIAFAIMGSLSLLAALYSKSDEMYYEDMTLEKLVLTMLCVAGMMIVGSMSIWLIERVGQIGIVSVLYYPTVFTTLLKSIGASSVFTCLLGEIIYQIAAVATGEEALKFVAYADLKERYGRAVAILIPVGFWAGFHALQAYSNILYVIPAFICGLLLLWLLEATKTIIAPILAHGIYNSICTIQSIASSPQPIFPIELTSGDIILVGIAATWFAWVLIPPLVRKKEGRI